MKLSVIALLLACLGGCASRGTNAGMTTTLEPGQCLDVEARGPRPVLSVVNRGPGQVVVEQQGLPAASIHLGTPGSTQVVLRHDAKVCNPSERHAEVDVRVTGADAAEIKGPAGPTKQ